MKQPAEDIFLEVLKNLNQLKNCRFEVIIPNIEIYNKSASVSELSFSSNSGSVTLHSKIVFTPFSQEFFSSVVSELNYFQKILKSPWMQIMLDLTILQ